MLKQFFMFMVVVAGLLALNSVHAATSIPMPEVGFALASNNGGSESITTPMPSDVGGGETHASRVADAALDIPSSDTATAPPVNAIARDGHASKTTPVDGSTPANSTSTSHKSRGNAHWQSLLPGLMK